MTTIKAGIADSKPEFRIKNVYANRGEIRKRHEHEQDTQTLCLNLLTNAVIAWNTIYIGRIQQHLANSETPLTDEAIRHTSLTIRAHLNVYGRYDLHAIKTPKTGQYRPNCVCLSQVLGFIELVEVRRISDAAR